MFIKDNIKNFGKVGVSVWSDDGVKFRSGKKSKTFRVYDATPDEVLEIIEKAIVQHSR